MLSVFLAHAPADAQFAAELRAFLESGCDRLRFADDDELRPEQDLIAAAELGRSAEVLVLLLSTASNPVRWPRERWEPVLFDTAPEGDTRIAVLLLEECAFPPLLSRKLKFFDATKDRLAAMRRLKRWVRGASPAAEFSADLEHLFRTLADRPGTLHAPGPLAERFAREAGPDFDAVFWIPAHNRTLAGIAGDLGAQLEMKLDGPLDENCRQIRNVLSDRRCLLVLDSPDKSVDRIVPTGRTSVLFTTEPVRTIEDEVGYAAARRLVLAGRFAEAYEILYLLLDACIDPESCARELVWICEHWGRLNEANALRFRGGQSPAEQLRLFL